MTALPVLYVVACGARPAADLPEFVAWSMGQGWNTCVIVTPSALRFADVNTLADLTRHPVRSDYKRPEDLDALPPADAFAVAPCTFNTVNKWAAGISDTLALGLLNEALCSGAPITAVPNPNVILARHPAFARNVAFLRECGVHVLLDPDRYPLPTPNLGEASRNLFPWEALKAEVTEMRVRVCIPDAARVDDDFALRGSRSPAVQRTALDLSRGIGSLPHPHSGMTARGENATHDCL
jgi:hypothetical protein